MTIEEHRQELEGELKRIVHILQEKAHPEKVVLFGSMASGKLRSDSDIDLLIIQNSNDSIFERVRKIEGLIKRKCAADLIVLTPTEVQDLLDANNRYLKNIFAQGKVLYDRAA